MPLPEKGKKRANFRLLARPLDGAARIGTHHRDRADHPAMIEIIRTDLGNDDFVQLVQQLDAELAKRDGDEHPFYVESQTKINRIKHVVIAYDDGRPAGGGAVKEYAPAVMEVKRMFTRPQSRGRGMHPKFCAGLKVGQGNCRIKNAFWKQGFDSKRPSGFTRKAATN